MTTPTTTEQPVVTIALTTYLDRIRRRASMVAYALATESQHQWSTVLDSQSDVTRLLGAIDAIVKIHVPVDHLVRTFCDVHDNRKVGLLNQAGFRRWQRATQRCPDCGEITRRVCQACDPMMLGDWPCPTIAAIRKGLAVNG